MLNSHIIPDRPPLLLLRQLKRLQRLPELHMDRVHHQAPHPHFTRFRLVTAQRLLRDRRLIHTHHWSLPHLEVFRFHLYRSRRPYRRRLLQLLTLAFHQQFNSQRQKHQSRPPSQAQKSLLKGHHLLWQQRETPRSYLRPKLVALRRVVRSCRLRHPYQVRTLAPLHSLSNYQRLHSTYFCDMLTPSQH